MALCTRGQMGDVMETELSQERMPAQIHHQGVELELCSALLNKEGGGVNWPHKLAPALCPGSWRVYQMSPSQTQKV